jgi:hypothetical protein
MGTGGSHFHFLAFLSPAPTLFIGCRQNSTSGAQVCSLSRGKLFLSRRVEIIVPVFPRALSTKDLLEVVA